MCGIFALFGVTFNLPFVAEQADKGAERGPDSRSASAKDDQYLAFYRLAINGLDRASDQPLRLNGKVLLCNGEIYNYKELYSLSGAAGTTDSDCEVIIHLYERYGIEHTLRSLDGVFAFVLIDNDTNTVYAARDQFGVRPLFTYNSDAPWGGVGFASLMKQLHLLAPGCVEPVEPGTYTTFDLTTGQAARPRAFANFHLTSIGGQEPNIHDVFYEAVRKRVVTTDRPVACLLSGGLDSSIVASIVSRVYKGELETYSIGLEGSEDLKYARMVADFLGTKHTEVVMTEQDFFDAIPEVIHTIESYDTTTVRASVGNMLVAKHIAKNSKAKVIFNGDGSDELMGGYLYMNHAPDALEFDRECKRLLTDIHYYDVLRSDRSISSQGLEPRTPFLDRNFVAAYLSIPAQERFRTNKIQEKYLFRRAFSEGGYLPREVLWRRKEAFSDGVSSQARSWYQVIQEMVPNNIDYSADHNPPTTPEQRYYRSIYDARYPDQAKLIPYFWMPRYVEATDCSARSLTIY